jgi:hypothetical protein
MLKSARLGNHMRWRLLHSLPYLRNASRKNSRCTPLTLTKQKPIPSRISLPVAPSRLDQRSLPMTLISSPGGLITNRYVSSMLSLSIQWMNTPSIVMFLASPSTGPFAVMIVTGQEAVMRGSPRFSTGSLNVLRLASCPSLLGILLNSFTQVPLVSFA